MERSKRSWTPADEGHPHRAGVICQLLDEMVQRVEKTRADDKGDVLRGSRGEWSRGAGLAGGFPRDHRENRRGETGSGFHQLICAGGFQLVSTAIAPQHAKAAHSDSMGPGNVMPAVSDHQAAGRRDIMLGQNSGEQLGLVIQRAARH
jgi:hypothetical protein